MFEEEEILDVLVHLVNGAISFLYTEKFLNGNFDNRKKIFFLWTTVYGFGQYFFSKLTESWVPHERFFNVIPYIIILIVLQNIFFEKSRARQIFVTASFTAGWEILRFAVSPVAYSIFGVWSPFWVWVFNSITEKEISSPEKIIPAMLAINRVAIFFVITVCRLLQFGLLIFYLRIIAERFSDKAYELKLQDSLFLIFPCAVVLTIDFTVRLMAFSADNGAVMLIYERVPETILLLPLVSLFLLGIIVSSVILFRHLIDHKAEEQKRLLLENRVGEIHREVEELSEIYSDIRGLRHDLRNHIENLAAYFRKNSFADPAIENYLRNMTGTVEKLDFADKTGNPMTDIIFHQTRQQSKKKGIHFDADFHCPKDGRFDIYDLCVILNNALQNSLEATEKIPDGKISIKSHERGGLFFIEVENNFSGEINLPDENSLPETTKREKNLHGIGLANIRRCAQKYLGDIDIKISEINGEKNFFLSIMLYQKNSDG